MFIWVYFWGFLRNLALVNIELTLILQFCFFHDLLKLHFLTRCLYFYLKWWKERGTKINYSNIFERRWGKNLESHKHSWLLIIWIFKKFNSLKSNYLTNYLQSKTTFWEKLTKNYIWYKLELSLPWANLCFLLIIALYLFGFELSRVNYSCFHFFSLARAS